MKTKLTKAQRNKIYRKVYARVCRGYTLYVCWALSEELVGHDWRYTPDFEEDGASTDRAAQKMLAADFPEFAMFKPRGVKFGQPWFGDWYDDEGNEQRKTALALCIAMTGGWR